MFVFTHMNRPTPANTIRCKDRLRCVAGPQYWPQIAPAAGGSSQSPVMIRSYKVVFCQTLRERPLIVSYNPLAADGITNNGHSVQVTVSGSDSCAFF